MPAVAAGLFRPDSLCLRQGQATAPERPPAPRTGTTAHSAECRFRTFPRRSAQFGCPADARSLLALDVRAPYRRNQGPVGPLHAVRSSEARALGQEEGVLRGPGSDSRLEGETRSASRSARSHVEAGSSRRARRADRRARGPALPFAASAPSERARQVGLVVTGRNPGWFQADDVSLVRTLAGRAGRKCKPGANCATVPPTTTTTATTTAPGATTTTTTVPTTTTTGTTTTTTTGTTTTTSPPPAPANARVARIEGSFDFDQTNASPASGVSDPTTLRLVSDRVYEGGGAAHAHLAANAASSNKFSRGIFHNLTWGAGTDVWYGVAVYLPVGFYAAQQGQIDLLRWDNWVDDPSTTDRGGITIYGPPAAGKAYLFRGRIGSPQNEPSARSRSARAAGTGWRCTSASAPATPPTSASCTSTVRSSVARPRPTGTGAA